MTGISLPNKNKSTIVSGVIIMALLLFAWSNNRLVTQTEIALHQQLKRISLIEQLQRQLNQTEVLFLQFLVTKQALRGERLLARLVAIRDLVTQIDANTTKDPVSVLQLREQLDTLNQFGTQLLSASTIPTPSLNLANDKQQERVAALQQHSNALAITSLSLLQSASATLDIIQARLKTQQFLLWSALILAALITSALVYRHRAYKQTQQLLAVSTQTHDIDDLTGLGNRQRFNQELEKEWKRSQRSGNPFYVMLVDIDNFRRFNDCYGQTAGDHALQHMADCLQEIFRRPSDIVCRYDREAFGVILPHTSDGIYLAESCCNNIAALKLPNQLSNNTRMLTASVGLAEIVGGEDENPWTSLRKVDDALFMAKQRGKNQWILA